MRYFNTAFAPDATVAAYANSTEMVRSLVSEGHGCAVLNMLPLTSESYSGQALTSRPISDPLPPLTLSIAYNRLKPRRIVQRFVVECRSYFAPNGSHRCIVTS